MHLIIKYSLITFSSLWLSLFSDGCMYVIFASQGEKAIWAYQDFLVLTDLQEQMDYQGYQDLKVTEVSQAPKVLMVCQACQVGIDGYVVLYMRSKIPMVT